MLKVTLDTNVIVSGSFWSGDSFRILGLIDQKQIICILSEKIIEEYNNIINSDEIIEKMESKSLILSKTIQKVIFDSEIVEPKTKVDIIKDDPADNIILECAKEGKSDFIITNDNHILKLGEFQGIKIVTPKEFLKHFAHS